MSALDLTDIVVAFKAQSAIDVPASGSGATGLELLASPGFASQIATVETEMLNRSLMQDRSRQGSEFFNWQGETELAVDNMDTALEAILGGTWAAAQTLTEADLTSVVISTSGSFTVLTFGGGSLLTEGVVAGTTAQFTALATSGNNSKHFPILTIDATGRIVAIPAGILVDETIDSAFNFIVAKTLYTATPYLKRYITMEHYLGSVFDRSLLGTNFVFNGFTLTVAPDKKIKIGVSLGGTALEMLATGDSPNFTDPVFGSGESLFLLDGAIYFNGVKRVDLSGINTALQGATAGFPLISTRTAPKPSLGQFKLTGGFTGMVADGADFDSWRAEDRVQVVLHCGEQSATPTSANYRTFCFPNMSFGDWNMPAAGEGLATQTVKLNGGRDKRGAALGFPLTSVIVSGTT